MSPGKQAPPDDAAPPVAAGIELERMRRRVRLSRLAVFTAIAAGPVALAVAVWSGPTTVSAAPTAKPTALRTGTPAADPSGYAQLFVGAWLRSRGDDADGAQARLAQSLAPDVDLPETTGDAQSGPVSVTAVRSSVRKDGVWAVTVAAQYAGATVRYYLVPVAADASGASFTVTGAPAVVAGPSRAAAPAQTPYAVMVPSDGDLDAAVGEFLGAYLAGAGEVDRYLAPGVHLKPVTPAPYRSVDVQQVMALEGIAGDASVADDGTTVHLSVQVEAQEAGGRWPLAYEMTMRARSGRWEVAALDTGLTAGAGGRS